jgi:adenylate cyclase
MDLKKLFKYLKDYIYFVIFLALLGITFSLPVLNTINYAILDRFQGQIQTRKEIVIIGIDDTTLQSIGAWPWDRDVFAQAYTELDKLSPRVVGLDVLLLEQRSGDENFASALEQSKFATVFGVKAENDKILEGKFKSSKSSQGLIDFAPDEDGKIRRVNLSRNVDSKCENSFGLEIFSRYLSIKNATNCTPNLTLRSNNLPNNFEFAYSGSSFTTYTFLDLYQGRLNQEQIKDKIVIIGSTAKDLRSNLNDNFTSVLGTEVNGVEIHANVVNSLLENKFQTGISYTQTILALSVLTVFGFWLNKKIVSSWLEIIFFGGLIVATNIVGIIVYGYGYNWYFVQSNLFLIPAYSYFIAHKYLVVKKQSRVVEKAFSKYVNAEILRQIKDNPELLKLGGERKEVTVLFSDIRGFTTFSEKLSPEELIQLINDYLTIMTDIILKNGGTVDKYIGDAIMAFWNAPISQENHRQLALKTCLEMEAALGEFNLKINEPIKIGVSLNTGEVIVGNVGSLNRFDYTILGDNVNLGSRLEGLTKKYGVTLLAAQSAVKGLDSSSGMIYRLIDEVKVKGKNKAIKIYQPLEISPENETLKEGFENAYKFYQLGDFTKAKVGFSKLETDPPAQKMLSRIETILATPELKNNWDGIWTWDEK